MSWSRPFLRVLCLCAGLWSGLAPGAVAQEAIGEVFGSAATVRGSVVLTGAGTLLLSGSSVTASEQAALVRLERGGEVRVCPRTTVSVTASRTGRDLLWAMSEGALELDFELRASADNLMTPDFRILLAGPGSFHIALRADGRGNTCVRSLVRNTAALIVYEQFGDGTFQVKPGEQVVFRNGRVAEPETSAPSDCGCPPPPEPARTAAATEPSAPKPEPPANPAGNGGHPPTEERAPPAAPAVLAAASEPLRAPDPRALEWKPESLRPPEVSWARPQTSSVTAPPPPSVPGEVRVQIDAPFVFRATDIVAPPPKPVARADLSALPVVPIPQPELRPAPPAAVQAAAPPPKKKKKRGFFSAIGSFFAALFGGRKG